MPSSKDQQQRQGGSGGGSSNQARTKDDNDDSNNQHTTRNERNKDKDFWTPPMWLTGEKYPVKPRQFVLQVPCIPAATHKSITAAITKTLQQRHPLQAEKSKQMNYLNSKLADQQQRVKTIQAKMEALEEKKETGLRDIRELRNEETKAAVEAIEKEMRQKHDKDAKESKIEWEKQVEEECNEKLKKRRLEEREASEERSKQQKISEDDQKKPAAQEEGEEPPRKISKGEYLKQELQQLKNNLESLQEKRSEMVWLLKHVIKAEEKQKLGVKGGDHRKPEAKITTSKQA